MAVLRGVTEKSKKEFIDSTAESIFNWLLICGEEAFEDGWVSGIAAAQAELIQALFDSGMEAEEIAKRLGMELGSVRRVVGS